MIAVGSSCRSESEEGWLPQSASVIFPVLSLCAWFTILNYRKQ